MTAPPGARAARTWDGRVERRCTTAASGPAGNVRSVNEQQSGAPRLSDVVRILDALYPPGTAESWDAVGTACGDPRQPVGRVLFAVDPTAEVVDEAVSWGADLLVTHHPLLLRAVHSVAATTFKGEIVHRLIRAGVALHVAHTNADAASRGVADALAATIGLGDVGPLVAAPIEPLDQLVVFVPEPSTEVLVDALAAAGAGALGEYRRCAWTVTGEGTFTPSDAAEPAIGSPGRQERVREARVEMVAPRRRRREVLAALRAAHPYEEPAFQVLELAGWDGVTGLGRVGRLPEPVTLRQFAETVARVLPSTVQGVRVAGELEAEVSLVAVLGGSGDSLFDAVRASGADVYLTSDLRHHPVSELRERAEFEARSGARPRATPYLVDVPHFASEWPWLDGAARDLRASLALVGTTVETRVSTRRTDPWTARLASSEGTTL